MNSGAPLFRILAAFCLAALLATPVAAQFDGSNDTGGNGRGGPSRDNDTRWGATGGTRLPGTNRLPDPIVVVPAPRRVTPAPTPRRVTRTPPPRRQPVPVPGDDVVPMTDTIRGGAIHTALGPGPQALTPGGAPEYVAAVPLAQADAAAAALTGAGALVLRRTDHANLGHSVLVVDLQTLTPDQARQVLATAAPGAALDVHAFYKYAQAAPRLYAAALIDQPAGPGCPLPGGFRIGQIDGPVATAHPSLAGAPVTAHSLLNGADPPFSGDHGTAVAALLVGQDPTGALAGFADGAELFAAGAFARQVVTPAAQVERIAASLDWLAGNRVRLINMSFSGPVNTALDTLLAATAAQGIVLIAAAGNDGRDMPTHPAASASVIGVTAVDAALRRYGKANTGAHIEFAAPGVDLYVANETGGGYATGTSYAAPILTALAARVLSAQDITAPELRARLRDQSVDLGESGRDNAYGWGLVKSPGC